MKQINHYNYSQGWNRRDKLEVSSKLHLPAGVDARDSSRAGVALAAASDFRPLAGAGGQHAHTNINMTNSRNYIFW